LGHSRILSEPKVGEDVHLHRREPQLLRCILQHLQYLVGRPLKGEHDGDRFLTHTYQDNADPNYYLSRHGHLQQGSNVWWLLNYPSAILRPCPNPHRWSSVGWVIIE